MVYSKSSRLISNSTVRVCMVSLSVVFTIRCFRVVGKTGTATTFEELIERQLKYHKAQSHAAQAVYPIRRCPSEDSFLMRKEVWNKVGGCVFQMVIV